MICCAQSTNLLSLIQRAVGTHPPISMCQNLSINNVRFSLLLATSLHQRKDKPVNSAWGAGSLEDVAPISHSPFSGPLLPCTTFAATSQITISDNEQPELGQSGQRPWKLLLTWKDTCTMKADTITALLMWSSLPNFNPEIPMDCTRFHLEGVCHYYELSCGCNHSRCFPCLPPMWLIERYVVKD
jgi:hypothetical protein